MAKFLKLELQEQDLTFIPNQLEIAHAPHGIFVSFYDPMNPMVPNHSPITKFVFSTLEGVFQTGKPPGGQNFEELVLVSVGMGRVQNYIIITRVLQVCFYNFGLFTIHGLKTQKNCQGVHKIEDQRIGLLQEELEKCVLSLNSLWREQAVSDLFNSFYNSPIILS